MIGLICGTKGSGKTKFLLDGVNERAKTAKGSIVFIDDDNSCMFDLTRSIRFINASEFGLSSPSMLYGFICGIKAQDFDLECVCIDGFKTYIKEDLSQLGEFFDMLKKFSDTHRVDCLISISEQVDNVPEYLQSLIVYPAK